MAMLVEMAGTAVLADESARRSLFDECDRLPARPFTLRV
jgi:hypothetical protein